MPTRSSPIPARWIAVLAFAAVVFFVVAAAVSRLALEVSWPIVLVVAFAASALLTLVIWFSVPATVPGLPHGAPDRDDPLTLERQKWPLIAAITNGVALTAAGAILLPAVAGILLLLAGLVSSLMAAILILKIAGRTYDAPQHRPSPDTAVGPRPS